MDPHWFYADPNPAFFLIADPDPVQNPRFRWPNLEKICSWKKLDTVPLDKTIATKVSLCLHKGRAIYMRSLQPSKKNIQHCKTWKFFTFFNICRSFALLDPDPGTKLMRVYIHADPDPQPWFNFNDMLLGARLPKVKSADNNILNCYISTNYYFK